MNPNIQLGGGHGEAHIPQTLNPRAEPALLTIAGGVAAEEPPDGIPTGSDW